jgi:hypothetical protein
MGLKATRAFTQAQFFWDPFFWIKNLLFHKTEPHTAQLCLCGVWKALVIEKISSRKIFVGNGPKDACPLEPAA